MANHVTVLTATSLGTSAATTFDLSTLSGLVAIDKIELYGQGGRGGDGTGVLGAPVSGGSGGAGGIHIITSPANMSGVVALRCPASGDSEGPWIKNSLAVEVGYAAKGGDASGVTAGIGGGQTSGDAFRTAGGTTILGTSGSGGRNVVNTVAGWPGAGGPAGGHPSRGVGGAGSGPGGTNGGNGAGAGGVGGWGALSAAGGAAAGGASVIRAGGSGAGAAGLLGAGSTGGNPVGATPGAPSYLPTIKDDAGTWYGPSAGMAGGWGKGSSNPATAGVGATPPAGYKGFGGGGGGGGSGTHNSPGTFANSVGTVGAGSAIVIYWRDSANTGTMNELTDHAVFALDAVNDTTGSIIADGTYAGTVPSGMKYRIWDMGNTAGPSATPSSSTWLTATNFSAGSGVWSAKMAAIPRGANNLVEWQLTDGGGAELTSGLTRNIWALDILIVMVGSSTIQLSSSVSGPFSEFTDNNFRQVRGADFPGIGWEVGMKNQAYAIKGTKLKLAAYLAAGRVVGFLNGGWSGSGDNDWISGTVPEAGAPWQRFIQVYASVKNRFTIGELHANSNNARAEAIVSEAAALADQLDIINHVETYSGGIRRPWFLVPAQRAPLEPATSDDQWNWARRSVRKACLQAYNARAVDWPSGRSDIYLVGQTTAFAMEPADDLHYDTTGFLTLGDWLGAQIGKQLLGQSSLIVDGPEPVQAWYNATTGKMVVKWTGTQLGLQNGGTGNIQGHQVKIAGVVQAVSSHVILSPTRTILQLATGLSAAALTFDYASGTNLGVQSQGTGGAVGSGRTITNHLYNKAA